MNPFAVTATHGQRGYYPDLPPSRPRVSPKTQRRLQNPSYCALDGHKVGCLAEPNARAGSWLWCERLVEMRYDAFWTDARSGVRRKAVRAEN